MLVFAAYARANEGGSVRGQVVDPALSAIADASIRAIRQKTGRTTYRSWSGQDGSFHLEHLESGLYRIAISRQGFREQLIDNVRVEERQDLDLGRVRLAIASCDAPGIICDSFSDEPPANVPFSHGHLILPMGCAVDVDKGKFLCTVVLDGPPATSPMRDQSSDFWVHATADKRVYLEPRNGARLAEPNSAAADCRGAVLLGHKVRVDGLGPGSDICLSSNDGRYVHVFFTAEVEPDSKQIAIYYVTR